MTRYLDQWIADVRVALGLNERDDTARGLGDTETLTIDRVIESVMEPAVQKVEQEAPPGLLQGSPLDQAHGFAPMESGPEAFRLPKDFIRLIWVRADRWRNTVSKAFVEGSADPDPRRFSSPALLPTTARPAAVLSSDAYGKVLHLLPAPDEDEPVAGMYLPHRKIIRDQATDLKTLDCSALLAEAAVRTAADMAAEVINRQI